MRTRDLPTRERRVRACTPHGVPDAAHARRRSHALVVRPRRPCAVACVPAATPASRASDGAMCDARRRGTGGRARASRRVTRRGRLPGRTSGRRWGVARRCCDVSSGGEDHTRRRGSRPHGSRRDRSRAGRSSTGRSRTGRSRTGRSRPTSAGAAGSGAGPRGAGGTRAGGSGAGGIGAGGIRAGGICQCGIFHGGGPGEPAVARFPCTAIIGRTVASFGSRKVRAP